MRVLDRRLPVVKLAARSSPAVGVGTVGTGDEVEEGTARWPLLLLPYVPGAASRAWVRVPVPPPGACAAPELMVMSGGPPTGTDMEAARLRTRRDPPPTGAFNMR